MKMKWIKNTSGKPDAMLTFACGGFVVVMFKVLFDGVSITLGGHPIGFGTIDASSIAAVLTPILGAYVGRKWTDANAVITDVTDEAEPSDRGQ